MPMSLKEHRLNSYLTLRDLASKAGVAVRTIWRIENSENKVMQISTMRKIAEALGVHPSEIAEFASKLAENR